MTDHAYFNEKAAKSGAVYYSALPADAIATLAPGTMLCVKYPKDKTFIAVGRDDADSYRIAIDYPMPKMMYQSICPQLGILVPEIGYGLENLTAEQVSGVLAEASKLTINRFRPEEKAPAATLPEPMESHAKTITLRGQEELVTTAR